MLLKQSCMYMVLQGFWHLFQFTVYAAYSATVILCHDVQILIPTFLLAHIQHLEAELAGLF